MSSKDKRDFLAQHRPELFDYSGVKNNKTQALRR